MIYMNKDEMALTLGSVNVMRNNIKKVLKANHGRSEGKLKLNVYDRVQLKLTEAYENEETTVYLTDDETEMLKSFIEAYTYEIERQVNDRSASIYKDITILKSISNRLVK